MKLPAYKRLFYNDFPQEAQKIIEQLSYTINNGFEGLFNVINNNISLRDNLFVSVRDITVNVDATGKPTSTAVFSVDNNNPIDGTQVIKATNQTNSQTYPTSGIFLSYSQNGNKV